VRLHRPQKKYLLDEMFAEAGHEVIRLPPYHSELNPIELIWGFQKSFVERHRSANTNGN
jgi:transposase